MERSGRCNSFRRTQLLCLLFRSTTNGAALEKLFFEVILDTEPTDTKMMYDLALMFVSSVLWPILWGVWVPTTLFFLSLVSVSSTITCWWGNEQICGCWDCLCRTRSCRRFKSVLTSVVYLGTVDIYAVQTCIRLEINCSHHLFRLIHWAVWVSCASVLCNCFLLTVMYSEKVLASFDCDLN